MEPLTLDNVALSPHHLSSSSKPFALFVIHDVKNTRRGGGWQQQGISIHPSLHPSFQLSSTFIRVSGGGTLSRAPWVWLLSDGRASHLTSEREPSHPEAHFSRLHLLSRSFGHDPKLVAVGGGMLDDRPVNRGFRLLASDSLHREGAVQRPHHCRHRAACRSPSPVSGPCFLTGRRVCVIQEVFETIPSIHNILGQRKCSAVAS